MSELPLAGRRALEGKRVLVTRAAHQAGRLSDALRAIGVEPVEVPVLEIQPLSGALDKVVHRIADYDWLIVTSANTVRALAGSTPAWGSALERAQGLKVACIGAATAEAAEAAGLPVTVVPETYVAEALVEEIAAKIEGQKILLARAAVARDVIPDALRAAGAQVDVVDAYRNVMPENAPGLLREALEESVEAATFTSSSSVTHLAEAAMAAGIAFPFAGVKAVSIGPITSATLRELGWEPAAEARVSDIAGLVEAVGRVLAVES